MYQLQLANCQKAQLPTVDKLHLTNLRGWKFGFFFPGRLLSLFPVEKAKLCDLWLKELFVIKARSLQLKGSHSGGRRVFKKKKKGGRLTPTT